MLDVVSFKIEEDLHRRLQRAAIAMGLTKSDVIRLALKEYLDKVDEAITDDTITLRTKRMNIKIYRLKGKEEASKER